MTAQNDPSNTSEQPAATAGAAGVADNAAPKVGQQGQQPPEVGPTSEERPAQEQQQSDAEYFLEGERLWTCSDCGDKFCFSHIGWDVCAPCALMRWSKGEI